MAGLLPNIDPDGLLEYSVVYTDRSLNHMSYSFQKAMNDVSSSLKKVYRAESVVLVPGGGTYGMEAVARQFATNADCLGQYSIETNCFKSIQKKFGSSRAIFTSRN